MAHFESRPLKQMNPHFIPDEIIFFDKQMGLTLIYREAVKEVETISWSIPRVNAAAETVKKSKSLVE